MKKALLLTLVLLCCASLAFAQGSVAVYADDGYGNMNPENCEIFDDTGPAFQYITIHFVHVADICATAVEFQADMSELTIIQDMGEIHTFPLTMGTFRDGTYIAYQEGFKGQIYLGSTTIKKPSTYRHLCKRIYVKNHPWASIPGATTPLAVSCRTIGHPAGLVHLQGSYAVVSWDFTDCPCPGTVPTEESSWGQIKALYE